MSRIFLVLVILVSLVVPVAEAVDLYGPNIVVPVVARTPGAEGTLWRTDVVVSNARRTGIDAQVVVTFVRPGAADRSFTVQLPPLASAMLPDIVLSRFGESEAMGMLRVTTSDPSARITARARVYNVGHPAGEFGQTVQGMPLQKLSRESYLTGISGVGGNRTNVGITNPHPVDADIFASLFDQDGSFAGGLSFVVPARSLVQISDVFPWLNSGPRDGATVQIRSSIGVYAYASIVRGDTGDASFVIGTGEPAALPDPVVTPACSNPAPLKLATDPAPGYLVGFNEGVNAEAETAALAAKYGFVPTSVFAEIGIFSATLSPEMIAGLRCEASVRFVEQNGYVPLP